MRRNSPSFSTAACGPLLAGEGGEARSGRRSRKVRATFRCVVPGVELDGRGDRIALGVGRIGPLASRARCRPRRAGTRISPVGSSKLGRRSASRRSVESDTGVRIAHGGEFATRDLDLSCTSCRCSDPLAADRPGLTATLAPEGTGHGVLPPRLDVDGVEVRRARRSDGSATSSQVGLVELVGAAVGARRARRPGSCRSTRTCAGAGVRPR